MDGPQKSAGYVLALSPMLLLVLGVAINFPWLGFIFFFGILPIVRLFLPDDQGQPRDLSNISAFHFRFLHAIPLVHASVWIFVLPWSMYVLPKLTGADLVGFIISLWVVTSLNLTICHELMHSPMRVNQRVARLMAGSIGYFQMIEEHKGHHVRAGSAKDGESPEIGESLYVYAAKRYKKSFSAAWQWERLSQIRNARGWWTNRVFWTGTITLGVLGCFGLVSGWKGVAIYVFLILGTAFTMQAITYIQHWGLSDRRSPGLAAVGYSWEDRCLIQAWVTLNHAYHGHHHRRPSVPYFSLCGDADAPRLPASYPVMLVAALLPFVFERAMRRRLESWMAGEGKEKLIDQRQSCADLSEFFRS